MTPDLPDLIHADEQPPLAERLRERIAREGSITFRDWMSSALYDEREGYYRRADLPRWGRAGDYRTSAERAPLFAATFARYFAALHAELSSPARFTILEAGAGACDFARTVLTTLGQDFPHVFAATRYVVEEIGGRAVIKAGEGAGEHDSDGAGEVAGVVFSNELIDAMPVHRVVMRESRLRELCVGLDGAGRFCWVEREPSPPRLAEHFAGFGIELAEGQCAEVNLDCEDWIARAASPLARGFVVTVDYGATAAELYDPRLRPRGTLRAFRAHALSDDPLAEPGRQDLTATINWSQLERAGRAAGLETLLLERQDNFLLRAGALEQLELMCARAGSEAERAALRLGAREMILPGGMAESFQVLVQKK